MLDSSIATNGNYAINYTGFTFGDGTYGTIGSDFRIYYDGAGMITNLQDETAFGLAVSTGPHHAIEINAVRLLANRGNGLGADSFLPFLYMGLDIEVGGWTDWFRMEWVITTGILNYEATAYLFDDEGAPLYVGSKIDLGIPKGVELFAGYAAGSENLSGMPVSTYSNFGGIELDNFKFERISGYPPIIEIGDIVGRAAVNVQWGEPGGSSSIVSVHQPFLVLEEIFESGVSANPAVGSSYYASALGRSPIFNHVSSSTGNSKKVADGGSFDYIDSGKNAPDYRSIVVWDNFVGGTLQRLSVETATSVLAETNSVFRWVIRQGTNWYASDEVATDTTYTTYSATNPAALSWYAFDADQNIKTVTFAEFASSITMDGIQSVEIYSKTIHHGTMLSHPIRYFQAEGEREVKALTGWNEFLTTHLLSSTKDADNDSDGLADWAEYVMGGNPNNANDVGAQPSLDALAGEYYFSLIGEEGIMAYVLTNSHLMAGVWGTNGMQTVSSTNSVLSAYTNAIDLAEDNLFIKLLME